MPSEVFQSGRVEEFAHWSFIKLKLNFVDGAAGKNEDNVDFSENADKENEKHDVWINVLS
jgi:hypothetical protein